MITVVKRGRSFAFFAGKRLTPAKIRATFISLLGLSHIQEET